MRRKRSSAGGTGDVQAGESLGMRETRTNGEDDVLCPRIKPNRPEQHTASAQNRRGRALGKGGMHADGGGDALHDLRSRYDLLTHSGPMNPC